jgi:hypothetical protein
MSAEEGERAKLAAEFAVFREDVVRSVNGEDLLGVVEGVGGHSDSEEDDPELEELAKGSARVSWYKKADNPATVAVDSLEVVDRALLHHDVVARRSAPLGQAGYVTAVDVTCTVRFLDDGRVRGGVDSRLLQQVQPLKQVRHLRPIAGRECGASVGALPTLTTVLPACEAGHICGLRAVARQGGRGNGPRHSAHDRRLRVPHHKRRP